MEIIGSIDNAALHDGDSRKPVYHLIFARETVVMARVLNRREELARNPIRSKEFGGGMQGSYLGARNMQMRLIKEAQERGTRIEQDLDSYISSNPEGLKLLGYSKIPEVTFSGGTVFKLPYLLISSEEGEMEFRLIHNNYAKAGKLDGDTYNRYLGTLQKAFSENLRIKK